MLRRSLPAAACLVVALLAGPSTASAAPRLLLPNLFQSIPRQLKVETDTTGVFPAYRLGFASAVHNDGRGPLIVRAHRADQSNPDMTADQVVVRSDGSEATYPEIGSLRYTYSPTHQHWHYLHFETYQLRRASDNRLIGTDQKTGFCLQDSFSPDDETLPGEPPEPVNHDGCGYDLPELLAVEEGISVGWTDVYEPLREGQSVDLTQVPAGSYYLIHRTNVDRRIHELDYTDDAASLLIRVRRPEGMGAAPAVRTLRSCYESSTCPAAPPRIAPASARTDARAALRQALRRSPRRVALRCPHRASRRARCRASWRDPAASYAGRVTLRSTFASTGGPELAYSARIVRAQRHCAASGCSRRVIRRSGRLPAGSS